jgi:23S rRNA (uracil1939-C5)-methyltransferase
MLQSEPAMAAAEALRKFMEEDNITSYDERWEKGLMRHMVVRTAFGTGQVMVILVINGKGIPNAAKLVEMLDEAIYNIPVQEEGDFAGIEFSLESVILNVNKKNTSEIFGDECITLAGQPTILEKVGDLQFEISPLSFYQVNPEQMKNLYGKVLEYADLKGDETVLDLYCGVGTIGLFCAFSMAQKGGKGRVIGIETLKEAVVDANRNAVINSIVNTRYICGKAEEVLPKLVSKSAEYDQGLHIEKADVIILDPPRAGCQKELLDAAIELEPEKIIYVSCDPATMARDIKHMNEKGYQLAEATPVDMFPWTASAEVVGLLVKN